MKANELTIYDFDLMPALTTLEYWKQLTDDNEHNRARIDICHWLAVRFDAVKDWQSFDEASAMHKFFSAIKTIAEDIGHMTQELMELRYAKTTAMLDLVRRHHPEAAEAIRSVL